MGKDRSARSATGFSVADTLARQVLQFCFSIFLARMLAPEEFGLLAMLYVFTGLASALSEGGLGAALVQGRQRDPVAESSAFQFNAAAGLAMTLLLCAAAPAIGRFYGHPGLVAVTMVMSLTVFINALGAIHSALVVRELRLGLQLRISLVSSFVSGLVAVWMAWLGHGVWSLVAQALVASTLNTVLLWTWHDWRPRHAFRMAALRPLLGYGSALMGAGILDLGVGRLYTLLVGRAYGAAPLGIYMRAVATQNLPQMFVGAVMRQVVFPVLAGKQSNPAHVRDTSRVALRAAMLLQTPCLLGIAATAEWLVPALFGQAWAASVPILQILCIAGCLYPVNHINLTVLKALGRSGIFLKLEMIKKAVLLLFLLAALPFGLHAIAWSQVAGALFAAALNMRHTNRLVGYGPAAQAVDAMPSLLLGTAMAGLVWGTGQLVELPDLPTLVILVPLGMVIYVAGGLLTGVVRVDELRRLLPAPADAPASAAQSPPAMLVLADSFPNVPESFIADHVRLMAGAGWDVTLLVRKQNPGAGQHPLANTRNVRIVTAPATGLASLARAGCWIARRPWSWRQPLAWRLALHGARIAGSVEARHPWDVVHAHYGTNAVAALVANPGWHPRLVADFHGYDATSVPHCHGWLAYHRVLRDCQAIAHSRFIGDLLRRNTSMRVHHVTMGVDLEQFTACPRPSGWSARIRLLCVGRLVRQKGHLQAIEALHWLREHRPALDAHLTIVGGGPGHGQLLARASELGLEARVDLAGPTQYPGMPSVYRQHDIMLMPSQPTPDGQQEAFGRAAAEAMACGLPVVGCRIGGLADTIGSGGIIADGFDAAHIAKAIITVLDRHPPDAWARRAREEAMKFSIRDMAMDYLSVARLATGECAANVE